MVRNEFYFDAKADKDRVENAYLALKEERESGRVGYYNLPDDREIVEKIKNFCNNSEFIQNEVQNVVVVGIGGSSLGTKAIHTMLSHTRNKRINLFFLENPDPVDIERILNRKSKTRRVKRYNTFFIMISKSGTTIETTSIGKFLMQEYDFKLDSWAFKDQSAIITDEGSPLDKLAKEYDLNVFHIPHNVGGRFSVLSAVGLLPLYIAGYDIDSLLDGAAKVRDSFFAKEMNELVIKAMFYVDNRDKLPMNVLFSYASELKHFNEWYVQLWAESLGKIDKNGNRVGLTPIHLIGAIDQHSFLQLIVQGPLNKTVTVIKVKDFENDLFIPEISIPYLEKTDFVNGKEFQELLNAECDATTQSMIEQGVPVDLIEIDKLNEFNAGYLIM
ncbi:MAG: glucose-6-phosphate isomerase, partial [Epsilonproteobacteria bacterium]|nr:glucose-6-phosphate isomerase [Campylobacterota bacterium]